MASALSIASKKFKERTAGVAAKLKKQSEGFKAKHKGATKRLKDASEKIKRKAAPAKKPAKSAKGKVSKFGKGDGMTVMHKGRKMANVTAEQLKSSGLSLRAYMNAWKKTGKRP